jgi:hypothetical protein
VLSSLLPRPQVCLVLSSSLVRFTVRISENLLRRRDDVGVEPTTLTLASFLDSKASGCAMDRSVLSSLSRFQRPREKSGARETYGTKPELSYLPKSTVFTVAKISLTFVHFLFVKQ